MSAQRRCYSAAAGLLAPSCAAGLLSALVSTLLSVLVSAVLVEEDEPRTVGAALSVLYQPLPLKTMAAG
ncbi:MAG: hypothetical protein U0531_12780 [Dehalococcoidia bacterium]